MGWVAAFVYISPRSVPIRVARRVSWLLIETHLVPAGPRLPFCIGHTGSAKASPLRPAARPLTLCRQIHIVGGVLSQQQPLSTAHESKRLEYRSVVSLINSHPCAATRPTAPKPCVSTNAALVMCVVLLPWPPWSTLARPWGAGAIINRTRPRAGLAALMWPGVCGSGPDMF